MNIPRGTMIGKRVDKPLLDETEHYIKCGQCGGMINCRDLGMVFDHEGPLPHPAQDRLS